MTSRLAEYFNQGKTERGLSAGLAYSSDTEYFAAELAGVGSHGGLDVPLAALGLSR